MRHLRSVVVLVLLAGGLAAADAPIDGDDRRVDRPDRLGLRLARALDATHVELVFGDSCVARVAEHADAYRIRSERDPGEAQARTPSAVKHSVEPDGHPPAGWSGRAYARHRVVLTLDRPLDAGTRWFVQALGHGGQPLTGGRAAAWIGTPTQAEADALADDDRLGVRAVEPLAPTMLRVTVGDGLDVARLAERAELIRIACADDPAYAAGASPQRIARVSRGECLLPDGWPYGFYQRHELILALATPLRPGLTYRVALDDVAPLAIGDGVAEVTLDDRVAIDPALKVNQVGYLPRAEMKRAYVGAWLGALGALDVATTLPRYELRDARTHAVIASGAPALRHRAAHDETAFKLDLGGEDVYAIDLSPLDRAGEYYVALPGCGRSPTFRVGDDVYRRPFAVMMNGVLHQRCGIAMAAPWSRHPRAACHRDDVELTDLPRGSEADAHRLLPAHALPGPKLDLFGGHHDAGDYEPRAHLEIAELAFMAYELHPDAFRDGQLRVPEAGNGVPDLLDEGRWALDLWTRLQADDGGVRGGTESNGDPDQTTTPGTDPLRHFAFAPDAAASLRFAACAAQASTLWRGLGKTGDADGLLARARSAWAWAGAHDGAGDAVRDARALAAIQLYRATGEAAFHDAFLAATPFAGAADGAAESLDRHLARDAAFWYARCGRPVDATVRAAIVAAFAQEAATWAAAADGTAYPFVRHPKSAFTWGTGAHPSWLAEFIQAAVVSGDATLARWITTTCDFALGCNPSGTVFTVGLGQRGIASPLNLPGRYDPDGPIDGTQCQGPSAQVGGSAATGSMGTWIGRMLYPTGEWPVLQTYCDVGMIPGMNEGIVVDQMRCAFAYAYLVE